MKILYFSDKWGYENHGIKRTIMESLISKGIDVIYRDKAEANNIIKLVESLAPDQIWLVHSGLSIPCDKNIIKQPIVGFGLSDPHYFSKSRFKNYDVYVTTSKEIYDKYKNDTLLHYSPDATDPRYYKNLRMTRDIDISFMGTAIHPWFGNKRERLDAVNGLRNNKKLTIHTFGREWPSHKNSHPFIKGDQFRDMLNRTKLGLDIHDKFYGPTMRVFDAAACATPFITRRGKETLALFKDDEEILTYADYSELEDKLVYYIKHPKQLRKIGLAAQKRCVKDHDIQFRVDGILDFIEEAM